MSKRKAKKALVKSGIIKRGRGGVFYEKKNM
jgi:hypothetical protein